VLLLVYSTKLKLETAAALNFNFNFELELLNFELATSTRRYGIEG
jgi:hypothetical protein